MPNSHIFPPLTMKSTCARVIEILSGRRRMLKKKKFIRRKIEGWKVNYDCVRKMPFTSFLFHQVLRDSQLENFNFSDFVCVFVACTNTDKLTYSPNPWIILCLSVCIAVLCSVCALSDFGKWVHCQRISNSFFSSAHTFIMLLHTTTTGRFFCFGFFQIFWE